MSVDAWGGGSDEDPKLRKREIVALDEKRSRKQSGVKAQRQWLQRLATILGALAGLAAVHYYRS